MYILNNILILFISISLISAEDEKYKCKAEDSQKEVEIGDMIRLCLHIPDIDRKAVFKIEVDEYSVISIKNGYESLIAEKESSTKLNNPSEEGHLTRNLLKEGTEEETETETEEMTEEENEEENKNEEETEGDTSSDDTTEEIKTEFIAQIGKIRTKFPTVNL